jgi:hypothetical protein
VIGVDRDGCSSTRAAWLPPSEEGVPPCRHELGGTRRRRSCRPGCQEPAGLAALAVERVGLLPGPDSASGASVRIWFSSARGSACACGAGRPDRRVRGGGRFRRLHRGARNDGEHGDAKKDAVRVHLRGLTDPKSTKAAAVRSSAPVRSGPKRIRRGAAPSTSPPTRRSRRAPAKGAPDVCLSRGAAARAVRQLGLRLRRGGDEPAGACAIPIPVATLGAARAALSSVAAPGRASF